MQRLSKWFPTWLEKGKVSWKDLEAKLKDSCTLFDQDVWKRFVLNSVFWRVMLKIAWESSISFLQDGKHSKTPLHETPTSGYSHIQIMVTMFKSWKLIETVLENCRNKEFFLVRTFLYSDWIRRLAQIQENTDQIKLHIWTLFTQWVGKRLNLCCIFFITKFNEF